MNILILGYGVEGKSVENYFKQDSILFEHTKISHLDKFNKEDLLSQDFSNYDLIFRTPSIPPKCIKTDSKKITSATKFFFNNCPAPIIGITGTKGKGTTCTILKLLLDSLLSKEKREVFLVGNIGTPALDLLPEITKDDIVIYELSSFQLWDLSKSPEISVVLRIEPDHLDVHESFNEYLSAKQNIVNFQKKNDYCIFFKDNKNTKQLVSEAQSKKLPYPFPKTPHYAFISTILNNIQVPGPHNKEDAEAALLAAYAYFKKYKNYKESFLSFLHDYEEKITATLKTYRPLPHHIEFVRSLNGIEYYDDSFSTVYPSLEAAIKSFPETPLVLILGGKDKGFDLKPTKKLVFNNPFLVKAILIGETSEKIAEDEDPEKFILFGNDFENAIKTAQKVAEEKLNSEEMNSDTCLIDAKPKIKPPVVLLSPCASSFDMFKDYKERGDIFKKIVNSLK